ncbi:MAG: TIGR03084 family metal-binding protein [Pseudomonadota bacterium]
MDICIVIKEAVFFLEETNALADLIRRQQPSLQQHTLFKEWTIEQIIRHLHFWNVAARISLEDQQGVNRLLEAAIPRIMAEGVRPLEDEQYAHFSGAELLSAWEQDAHRTSSAFRTANPEERLPWVGPPMNARSSISARLMETWAHGQAIYDVCGLIREDTDRIYPIVELGIRTFGWTYAVRGEEKPKTKPFVRLIAPSGEVWTFNDSREDERIEGSATSFCQIVTQTRSIKDVSLNVTGSVASDWMNKAQCFAGGPEIPPAPGVRRRSI